MQTRLFKLLTLLSFFCAFSSFGFDIGVSDASATDSVSCVGGTSSISAEIQKFGTQQVDSFYVYVELNGVPFDTIQLFQVIPAGQQVNLFLGNFSLTTLVLNSVVLRTGLPNGTVDTQTTNDGYSFILYSRLSGDYTVGCPSCDFQTFTIAKDHLVDFGVCGPTIFNLVDGTYNSAQISQVILNPYIGMSAANPVVFQSLSQDANAVLLTPSVSPLFRLNNVNHITFKNLTFQYSGNSTGIVLNSNDNITIDSCRFINASIYTQYNSSPPDSLIISNSFFFGTSVQLVGKYPPIQNESLRLLNNSFTNSYLQLNDLINIEVSGNQFNSPSISHPLRLVDCENGTVSKNFIRNAENGLSLEGGCVNISVINNFLRGSGRVLSVTLSDSIYIVNNSIYQYDPSDAQGEAVYLAYTTGSEFMNNILFSEEYGYMMYWQDTSYLFPNHNIYYGPSDTLIAFGSISSPIYQTYQDWTEVAGKDSNSYFMNPYFMAPNDLHLENLVIADGAAFPFPGISKDIDDQLRPTTFDIGADEFDLDYSTLRDIALIGINSPDSTACTQTDSIWAKVANYSTFQIDSFAVQVILFGKVVEEIWNYTSLGPGDTTLVNFGAFHFSPNTLYDFGLFLILPNGQNDNYELNNFDKVSYQWLTPPKIFTWEVSDCVNDVELTIPRQRYSTVVWSSGESTPKITVNPPGSWTVTLTDQNGCMTQETITLN